MPTAMINNHQLYFEHQGEGEVVVYLHGGFPSLQMAMRDLKPYDWGWELDFAKHFKFIWYDRRGCYRSSQSVDGYSLEKQANDLKKLLDMLGASSVHLIGSSAGGPIATLFSATYPNYAKSLILTGTALDLFPIYDKATQIIQRQLEILDQLGAETAFDQRPDGVEASLDILWAKDEAEERGTLEQFLAVQQRVADRVKFIPRTERITWYEAELNSIRAYMEFDLSVSASHVHTPTMILHGRVDRVLPLEWAVEMSKIIPNNELVIIDSGSHSLMIKSRVTRDKAIQFIKSHSDTKSHSGTTYNH